MKLHFLPSAKRNDWLAKLAGESAVYFPAVVGSPTHLYKSTTAEAPRRRVHWQRLDASDLDGGTEPEFGLDRIRAAEPIKSFFFSPRERVASFPEKLEPGDAEKRILFGAKGCDMLPLKVHEKMFLEGEFKDPFYEARLRSTVFVVADCPAPEDSCFCNLVGRTPYSHDEGDIVLSVVDGGYVLEPLTDEGEELIRQGGDSIQPATDAHVAARDESRKAAVAKLTETNPKPPNPELPAALNGKTTDDGFWAEHFKTCVECYGCLMTCPTCYCYLLYDQAKEAGLDRTKVWDACYIAAYQRVGGGANARGEFYKRFANRYHCKFEHFKNAHGFAACSGCGRCTQVCMGKIDVRNVLRAL